MKQKKAKKIAPKKRMKPAATKKAVARKKKGGVVEFFKCIFKF